MISQLIQQGLRAYTQKPLQKFIGQTQNGIEIQQKVLQQILTNNATCHLGRKYQFGDLKTVSRYQDIVPVHTYEKLRAAIAHQAETGEPELTLEQPIFYTRTSGTTATPKYIPVTQSALSRYRSDQRLAMGGELRIAPQLFNGKALIISSAVTEGYLASGLPYGSMSGLLYQCLPWFMRKRSVSTSSIFEIEDYPTRYQQLAKLAEAEPNISVIAAANPSTLLKLLQVMGRESWTEVCPHLAAVVTWTGGSCGTLLPRLKACLPPTTQIIELGYQSSEFRGSLTIDSMNRSLLTYHRNFYEFVERESWEKGQPTFTTMENLQIGQQYYIFVTTPQGLYRYAMDDIVEVTDYQHTVPYIRFIQKGKGITNLTGEKLYESQLIQAINHLSQKPEDIPEFFIMLGNSQALQYTLYLDASATMTENIRQSIDLALSAQNHEFAAKRNSTRLRATMVKQLRPGTYEAYKRHCLAEGQRDAQFKVIKLQYRQSCSFNFDAWVLP